MRTISYSRYGSPEVIRIQESPKPQPSENEVLIKIYSSVVTPSDIAFRTGSPFISRFFTGLRKPVHVPGVELAGVIEAVGEKVDAFKIGDKVYGSTVTEFGAHAEYKCLDQSGVLAKIPKNMSFEEAICLADGALTSLVFLRDVAQLKANQHILINGASGAVGVYALQLAKYYGAETTAVCSHRNIELVKSQGADHIIDYTKDDFTLNHNRYDVIFDAVGKRTFRACKPALTQDGLYMTTVPTLDILGGMLASAFGKGKKAKFVAAGLQQHASNLEFLTKLAEEGHLSAVIDRTYPLEQIKEAHTYVESERKRGNVVIQMG
ncbi:MAG: NAD(P)-dependent alcohol dehydrogenase [Bacteroidota bacterium]